MGVDEDGAGLAIMLQHATRVRWREVRTTVKARRLEVCHLADVRPDCTVKTQPCNS